LNIPAMPANAELFRKAPALKLRITRSFKNDHLPNLGGRRTGPRAGSLSSMPPKGYIDAG
jgi:hypothetical protein